MRRSLKTLVALLDGAPTGMKGQSLVELSVTMPIFLIMLIGMVEVGWYANNYLILSDVVRSAGRFGSLRDPILWPAGEEKNYNRLDCELLENAFNKTQLENVASPPTSIPGGFIGPESNDLGYFDGVACAAIANMAPLEFKDLEDDIIVSVFSYARFPLGCDNDPATTATECTDIRVTGRYPIGQNECDDDTRDPFDFTGNNTLDVVEQVTDTQGYEGFDGGGLNNEGMRGYVFRGNENHDGCIGSQYSVGWMENRLHQSVIQGDNAQNLTNLERGLIPNYGLVLVEMYWNSYQLLQLPLYSWVGNPLRLHVWSIFPVTAAEPDLD